MRSHEAAALAALQEQFGSLVTYTGAGLNGSFVQTIKSDAPGLIAQGFDGRARQVSFEVPKSALPTKPANGDRILDADQQAWRVTDVTDRGDVEAWLLVVEEAQ